MMEKQSRKNIGTSGAANRSVHRTENGSTSDDADDEVFTVEEAINGGHMGGAFQAKLIVLMCFIWMSRGIEDVLVTYIGPVLSCDWKLVRWKTALVVTSSEILSAIGSVVYGVWSDKYGRRAVLSSSLVFVFVFGAVSAGLPSFEWFVVFRMVCAFAIGGLPQAFTLVVEFIPSAYRGRAVFILSIFWAIGVLVMITIFHSTSEMPDDDWRNFIALSAIPSCLSIMMMKYYPESIRYLLVSNQNRPASIITEEMAVMNKQNLPNGILEPARNWKKRGRFTELCGEGSMYSTVLLYYVGLATACTFWGLRNLSPVITSDEINDVVNINGSDKHFMGDIYVPVECVANVTYDQFIKIVWTNALDFPGIVIYMILVDIINRKLLLSMSCIISAVFTFLLYIPTANIIVKTAFLYCSRTLLTPQFDLLLLITAEANPTTHRGLAIGLEVSTFYIGSFISPYIYQGIKEVKYLLGFYGGITLLSGIAIAFLPKKITGIKLMETPDDK